MAKKPEGKGPGIPRGQWALGKVPLGQAGVIQGVQKAQAGVWGRGGA